MADSQNSNTEQFDSGLIPFTELPQKSDTCAEASKDFTKQVKELEKKFKRKYL